MSIRCWFFNRCGNETDETENRAAELGWDFDHRASGSLVSGFSSATGVARCPDCADKLFANPRRREWDAKTIERDDAIRRERQFGSVMSHSGNRYVVRRRPFSRRDYQDEGFV